MVIGRLEGELEGSAVTPNRPRGKGLSRQPAGVRAAGAKLE
jgi:hypothetical protein